MGLHRQGKLKEASELYRGVLQAQPDHFDALHLLGVLKAQQGDAAEAVRLISLALEQRPQSAEALFNLGLAQSKLSLHEQALASYDKALAVRPDYPDALYNRGNTLAELKRPEEALASYDRALGIQPDHVDVLYNRGNALRKLERHEEAIAGYERVLSIKPDYVDALLNRGNALRALNRHAEAIESYDKALRIEAGHADVLYNRGNALQSLGRHEEAIASYDSALVAKPDYAEVFLNRGNSLAKLDRREDAVASFDGALAIEPAYVEALYNRAAQLAELEQHDLALAGYDEALRIKPDYIEAILNRGNALVELNRLEEAILTYEKALAIRPDYFEAFNNKGNALQALNRREEAIASYDKALAINPGYAEVHYNRGNTLAKLNRQEEAAASYEKALASKADYKYVLGAIAHARAHSCDWRGHAETLQRLLHEVRSAKHASGPFPFLASSSDPADQLLCARTFVRDKYPASARPVWKGERYEHERIRVAYLSADFHEHATAYLMAGLFEQHDRTRFETTAVSFGPDSPSEMRTRLKGAFGRFIDVRQKSDREVAELLRQLEIDIAVDLKGFTTDCRPGIFAQRPAPIQVNYLGYPGTMGAEYYDYILADRVVIPQEHQPYYTEKVVYLPECYQVNDSRRRIDERTPSRAEAGLPEQGFVFCSFNNNYKITPAVFDVWMRLLKQMQGSVLWLLEANPVAARNLRREAQARGVEPARLVFASRVKLPEHLARHHLADLFLDTLPYNAHTTASDALWVGLPVLTCLGTTFAGRVAASLLYAIGMPELVTQSMEQYEALALKLATDPELLHDTRQKLSNNRPTTPLFDTGRFTRHVEAAYTTMWSTYQ